MVDADAVVERSDAMFSGDTTLARKAKAPAPASSHHIRTMTTRQPVPGNSARP